MINDKDKVRQALLEDIKNATDQGFIPSLHTVPHDVFVAEAYDFLKSMYDILVIDIAIEHPVEDQYMPKYIDEVLKLNKEKLDLLLSL